MTQGAQGREQDTGEKEPAEEQGWETEKGESDLKLGNLAEKEQGGITEGLGLGKEKK